MATINQDNINFTNINNDTIFAVGGKYSHSSNDDGSGKFDTTLPGDEITKSINAVEIDWNGATTTMGGEQKLINTSGDLISYLATAYTNAYTAVKSNGGVDNDTVNSLISSYLENKIPIKRYSQFPFDYPGNGYPLQNCVTIGGRISYIYPDDPDTTHNTFSTSIINLNHPLNVPGAPDNAVRTISFSYSRSNNAEPVECAYFDGNGYLHLKDVNFNSLYDKFYDINQSLANKADGQTVSLQINKLTPKAHQSGNSGYIIAYDTTTGNLFKSLATVNDTGVFFTSDISLKENVEQIIDSEIDKLFETESGNMYSFDWKDSHEHSFGFIAQELEQFAPEAVHEFDGIKKVNYEVALTKVCGAMFKKIKQLESRIDELEK